MRGSDPAVASQVWEKNRIEKQQKQHLCEGFCVCVVSFNEIQLINHI